MHGLIIELVTFWHSTPTNIYLNYGYTKIFALHTFEIFHRKQVHALHTSNISQVDEQSKFKDDKDFVLYNLHVNIMRRLGIIPNNFDKSLIIGGGDDAKLAFLWLINQGRKWWYQTSFSLIYQSQFHSLRLCWWMMIL